MTRQNVLIIVLIVVALGSIPFLRSGTGATPPADTDETTVQATTSPAAPVKKTTTKAPAPATTTRILEKGQYVTIVKLTSSGFVPQAVSIARGESVRFVNASGSSMRILSTEYTGLNQEKSVGQNGIYELNFPKPGTWAFHNGTNLNVIGVVSVH